MAVFMPCGPVFPTGPFFLGSRLRFCVRSLDDAVLKFTSVLNKLFAVIRILEIRFWDLHCPICSVYYLVACYYNMIVGQYITVLLPLSVNLTLLQHSSLYQKYWKVLKKVLKWREKLVQNDLGVFSIKYVEFLSLYEHETFK